MRQFLAAFLVGQRQLSCNQFSQVFPLWVRPTEDGIETVDREHQWEACKELGFEKIPADIEKLTREEAKRRNVIRNKDRGHLWYFRLSKLFNEDIERGVKPRDLTKRYGYSKSSISHIKDICPRLKDTEELYIYNFSNMDLVNLARVENDIFRKALVKHAKEKPPRGFKHRGWGDPDADRGDYRA